MGAGAPARATLGRGAPTTGAGPAAPGLEAQGLAGEAAVIGGAFCAECAGDVTPAP